MHSLRLQIWKYPNQFLLQLVLMLKKQELHQTDEAAVSARWPGHAEIHMPCANLRALAHPWRRRGCGLEFGTHRERSDLIKRRRRAGSREYE